MVLLRESRMTQPLIAAAMGVSLSTVNRAHMAYDHGGIKVLKRKPRGGQNMTHGEEKALLVMQNPDIEPSACCKLGSTTMLEEPLSQE
jgi:transposase